MRLESALYASFGGLYAHGQAIAVIGDNIANASTPASKASRAEFSELFSAGLGSVTAEPAGSVGSGVAIKAIRQIQESGDLEFTSRDLDAGISGNGFFMVGDPASPLYSRAGNFQLNEQGILVNSDGLPVLGLAGTGTALSTLNLVDLNIAGTTTSAATVSGNLSAIDAITTAPANPQTFAAINQAASYVSNVRVYDSLGTGHDITLALSKTGANTWIAQAFIDSAEVGGTAGVPKQLGANATLTFSNVGVIDAADKAKAVITAAPTYGNGAAAGNFTLDFSAFTQFASQSQLTGFTQNGQGAGNVKSYEIRKDGQLNAVLESGSRVTIGTLQLASFPNVDGLKRIGSGTFRAEAAAGTPSTGAPGTLNLGSVEGGALERSTVDIAGQFVDLVLYQRGYQANSQTLNAASSLLRDTIALIR